MVGFFASAADRVGDRIDVVTVAQRVERGNAMQSNPARLLHVSPDAVVLFPVFALVQGTRLRLGHTGRDGVATGELVGPPVDVAVRLEAGQQAERAGALLDDLLEVWAAAPARARRRGLALRLWPAARRRRWFCSHRPTEFRTPYGASIDWIREASSLILNGLASV